MDHPLGLEPPPEWFQGGQGHTSSAEFQKWIAFTKPTARRGKFNANVGRREDLGHALKSNLEANTERLLRFIGFVPWTEKGDPPSIGKFYRYEGAEYLLTTTRGKTVGYKPDFHLWENGKHTLWESKGFMDQRSKKKLRLMEKHHPEIPVVLITGPELDGRVLEAMREARRHGWHGTQIPNWE